MTASHPLLTAPSPQLKSHIAATYDTIAPRYLQWTAAHADTKTKWLDELITHLYSPAPSLNSHPSPSPSQLPAPLTILELGAGAGHPGTQLLSTLPNAKIIANDISPVQIALAEELLQAEVFAGKVECRVGDMMALEFADGSLSAVVGLYSIFHLPREEQRVLLGRVGRWLRKGGWVLVNFPGEAMEGVVLRGWLWEKGGREGRKGGEDGGVRDGEKRDGERDGEERLVKGAEGDMYWSGWSPEESMRCVEEAGLRVRVAEMDGKEGKGPEFLWVLAEKE